MNDIQNYAFENGIGKSYKNWIWHREEIRKHREWSCLTSTTKRKYDDDAFANTVEMLDVVHESIDGEEFNNILEDAGKPLLDDCIRFT